MRFRISKLAGFVRRHSVTKSTSFLSNDVHVTRPISSGWDKKEIYVFLKVFFYRNMRARGKKSKSMQKILNSSPKGGGCENYFVSLNSKFLAVLLCVYCASGVESAAALDTDFIIVT